LLASQLLIDYAYARQARHRIKAPFFASSNMAVPADSFKAAAGTMKRA
jgi:hypothetical protein